MRNFCVAFVSALIVGFLVGTVPGRLLVGEAEAGERRLQTPCNMNISDAGYADSQDAGCGLGPGLWYTFQCDGGVTYTKDGNIPLLGVDPSVTPGDPYPFAAQRCGTASSQTACPLRYVSTGAAAGCNVFAADNN